MSSSKRKEHAQDRSMVPGQPLLSKEAPPADRNQEDVVCSSGFGRGCGGGRRGHQRENPCHGGSPAVTFTEPASQRTVRGINSA